MPVNLTRAERHFAKLLAAACVRRGYLEKLHEGAAPITRTGDYSDVKVVDAEGREIPWKDVSRISQDEMKTLMTGVVDRIYTFLARTLFVGGQDEAFQRALDRTALPWIQDWDEPRYLPDFLMPPPDSQTVDIAASGTGDGVATRSAASTTGDGDGESS